MMFNSGTELQTESSEPPIHDFLSEKRKIQDQIILQANKLQQQNQELLLQNQNLLYQDFNISVNNVQQIQEYISKIELMKIEI
jgi:hypothetical protein